MIVLTVEKELKIKNVATLWKQIRESEEQLEVNCSALEKIDGAGMQLLIYLDKQEYRLAGLSDQMKDKIKSKGYSVIGDKT